MNDQMWGNLDRWHYNSVANLSELVHRCDLGIDRYPILLLHHEGMNQPYSVIRKERKKNV